MEEKWERIIPYINLSTYESEIILKKLFSDIIIENKELINIGCRNSNYKVTTNRGKFLVRISSKNEAGCINEIAAANLYIPNVNKPRLLYCHEFNKALCMVYKYIENKPLKEDMVNDDVMCQLAKQAAYIHKIQKDQLTKFKSLDFPELKDMFKLFLDNKNTKKRLGSYRLNNINKMLDKYEKSLELIEEKKGFIHSDFKISNMILSNENKVYITDWEYCTFGHIYADIGQLFRYIDINKSNLINTFEEVYNYNSEYKLEKNWVQLSFLRDLVNPLQLLSSNQDMPNKCQDLLKIVDKVLLILE